MTTESDTIARINARLAEMRAERRPVNVPLAIACLIAPSLAYIAARLLHLVP